MSRPVLEVVLQEDLSCSVPHILDQHGNEIPCRETELRIMRMAEGLRRLPGTRFITPDVSAAMLRSTLKRVHHAEYLEFLEGLSNGLGKDDTVMYHPFIPQGVDADTPIVAGIFDTAMDAAGAAMDAAMRIAGGARFSYALCRPPGHHAGRSWLGGHCYLNNAVVALHTLREAGFRRPGLIDFDFHFGNGTADLLAESTDTFFGSIHSSTIISYPYGQREESHDRHLFIPFADDPGHDLFLESLALLLEHAMRTDPEVLVVSVGYDIIAGDPFGKWDLRIEILEEIGTMLASAGIALCLVQEGGYRPEHLDECAYRLGCGLLGITSQDAATERLATTGEELEVEP